MSSLVNGHPAYVVAFTLDGLPKLPNELLHAHWRVVHRHRNDWHLRVLGAVGKHKPPYGPLVRSRVTFTRFSSRQPDDDGLSGGFKHVRDGLIAAGVIEDDSPEHIEAIYEWKPGKPGKGYISVLVEEIE